MTRGLHDISKQLKTDLELKEAPNVFLGKKVNLVYNLNPFGEYRELSQSVGVAVQNTWYTVCDLTNVEFLAFAVQTTVSNETCEIRVYVDGHLITSSAAVALTQAGNEFSALPDSLTVVDNAGAWYFVQGAAAATVSTVAGGLKWCKGRSVRIDIRKTTAAGAAVLYGVGAYLQW